MAINSLNLKIYHFLFHPFEEKSAKTASITVHIALTILTGGLWQFPFWLIHYLEKKSIIKVNIADCADPDSPVKKADMTAERIFKKNEISTSEDINKHQSAEVLPPLTPSRNPIPLTDIPLTFQDIPDFPVECEATIIDGGHIQVLLQTSEKYILPERCTAIENGFIIPIQHCHLYLKKETLKEICEQSEEFSEIYLSQFDPIEGFREIETVDEEKGLPLLREPGDYFVSGKDLKTITFTYLNPIGEISTFLLREPRHIHYWTYRKELDFLNNPVGYETESQNSKARMVLQGYLFQSIINVFEKTSVEDAEKIYFKNARLNLLSDFLDWATTHGQKNEYFNPCYFLKLVGHQFGLSGKFSFELECIVYVFSQVFSIDLEGTHSKVAIRQLCEQAKLFLDKVEERHKPALQKTTDLMFELSLAESVKEKNKTNNNIIEHFRKGTPISIPLSWSDYDEETGERGGHAVNIVISQNYISYTNKGQRKTGNPGRSVYKINQTHNIEDILYQLIDFSAENFSPERDTLELFLTQTMHEKLKLEKVLFIKGNDQKVGNCTFASNKSFLGMARVLLELEEGKMPDEAKASFCEFHLRFATMQRTYWLERLTRLIESCEWPEDAKNCMLFIAYLCGLKCCLKKDNNPIDENVYKPEFVKNFLPESIRRILMRTIWRINLAKKYHDPGPIIGMKDPIARQFGDKFLEAFYKQGFILHLF